MNIVELNRVESVQHTEQKGSKQSNQIYLTLIEVVLNKRERNPYKHTEQKGLKQSNQIYRTLIELERNKRE